jgi:exodeoxyribonuclease VII large subunit
MDEDTLSVAQLLRRAGNGIAREMRGQVWVHGEVRNLKEHRGSWYLSLVEGRAFADGGDVLLDVAAWPRRREALHAQLQQAGVALAAGMHVRVRGIVGLSKTGKVQLELYELDLHALLGAQAADKRRLLAALTTEGLLRRNAELAVPEVPLRVGLVTSEGSEGHRDFAGQLERSPFSFDVALAHTPVQGPAAAAAIARAVSSFPAGSVDVIAVVRGGGGELDAFDKEPVARAIATAASPVWTGIGHTGDRSVADDVANRHFITPTACGQALVAEVEAFHRRLVPLLERAAVLAARRVDRSDERLHDMCLHLRRGASGQLDHTSVVLRHTGLQLQARSRSVTAAAEGRIGGRARAVHAAARRVPVTAATRVAALAERLERSATSGLGNARALLDAKAAHVRASDPRRPLRLGYSLTLREDGSTLKSVHDVSIGEVMRTLVGDGELSSTVVATQAGLEDDERRGARG